MQTPVFKVEYENKDITASIAPNVLSVNYTDFEHGQSDEVEIQLEDKDHLWKSSWYPTKGDSIKLSLGYAGEKLLNCGSFEIDEMEFILQKDSADNITLKALAANIKKALRQNNSVAYENKTLLQIAQEIANKHNLKLVGKVRDIKIKRITQNNKRDLEFLKILAEEYGYIFKVSDNKLTFYEIAKLKDQPHILFISRQDIISYSLRDKTHDQYNSCRVVYLDPKKKDTVSASINGTSTKADVLKLHKRCENKEQAILKANAALNKNSELEGTITVIGNPHIVAGLNIQLNGLYKLNGKYHIKSVKHIIDKNTGYRTELEVEKC
jgi:phage protein D